MKWLEESTERVTHMGAAACGEFWGFDEWGGQRKINVQKRICLLALLEVVYLDISFQSRGFQRKKESVYDFLIAIVNLLFVFGNVILYPTSISYVIVNCHSVP